MVAVSNSRSIEGIWTSATAADLYRNLSSNAAVFASKKAAKFIPPDHDASTRASPRVHLLLRPQRWRHGQKKTRWLCCGLDLQLRNKSAKRGVKVNPHDNLSPATRANEI